MAFRIKRGMVLRTTGAVKAGKKSLPKGTRVKAMIKLEGGGLRVKIKDDTLPKTFQGMHIDTDFDHVQRVPRGRPALDAE